MTVNVHEVGVQLLLRSNINQMLPEAIQQFETLDKVTKSVHSNISQLVEGFQSLKSASRSMQSLRRAMEGFGKEKPTAAMAAMTRMAEQMQGMRTLQQGMTTEAKEMATAWRQAATAMREGQQAMGPQRRRTQAGPDRSTNGGTLAAAYHEHGAAAGMAAQQGGHELTSMVERMMHSAMEPAYFQAMLRSDQRVSAQDATGAYDAAFAATRSAPGTTLGKNMEAVTDLKSIFGSLDEAVKILPGFANLSATLAAVDRKGGGQGDPAFAAAKALEILGGINEEKRDASTGRMAPELKPELLNELLEKISRVAVATAGRVSPETYLSFAKQARVGGMNLSNEFLYEKLPAMLMVMGGDRAGTAIQSISQVFQGGRMTGKSFEQMQQLGLTGDAHMVGKGTKAHMEGKVFEQDLLSRDPAEWAKKVYDHLRNDLHMSEEQALNSVQKFAQRNTIAGFLADLMKDQAGIAREQQTIRNTSPASMQEMMGQNPVAKMQQFHASLENLMAVLAGPAMEPALRLLGFVTTGLNRLGDWAKDNGPLAGIMVEVAGGLGVLATAIGAIGVAVMIYAPAFRMLAALGGAGAASGVLGAAGGGLMGLLKGASVPLLGGALAHAADSHDNIGQFINRHVPGAASIDDWVYRKTGGWVGTPAGGAPSPPTSAAPTAAAMSPNPSGPQHVIVDNGRDIARGVSGFQAGQANRPPAGPGSDPRMTPTYTGSEH